MTLLLMLLQLSWFMSLTVDVVTTDNGFVVVAVVITGVVVLVLLQHRLDFGRIYEKASNA